VTGGIPLQGKLQSAKRSEFLLLGEKNQTIFEIGYNLSWSCCNLHYFESEGLFGLLKI
jgi:hypothetical protein